MTVIFDLDQTLIDTSIALQYREARTWNKVYELIPRFKLYEGIADVIHYLSKENIPYCIVTASPSSYCQKVCTHWGINNSYTVCYHDTSKRKPHPDPINLAITRMRANIKQVISFGDRDIDIIASNTAGVISVACMWGCEDKEAIKKASPNYIIEHPSEIIILLKKFKTH